LKGLRSTILLIVIILLVIGVLVGLAWASYRFSLQNPGGNDFLARWMGARYWVVQGISPYDEQVSLATQNMIYGHPANVAQGEDKNHFVYPLYSMLFFAPFGPLEYPVARALWMSLTVVCLFLLAITSIRLADWQVSPLKLVILIIFSIFWYHSVRTVIIGQFAGINALLVTLALLLVMRKQDFAAGLLLALSTSKPQMVFLILPFVFLWALSMRRRDIIGGMLIGLAMLIVGSIVLLPDWPLQWLRQLFDYPSYTSRIGSPLSVIADYTPGIGRQVSTFLHIITLGYLVIEWVLALRKDARWFRWTALLTIVITNLVAYRTATTNFMMMLPVLFLVFSLWEARWRIGGRIAVWTSLIILGVGSWALFLSTVQGNEEQAVMYLPFPLFCLVGLWWVRWWAISPPRQLLKDMAERVD